MQKLILHEYAPSGNCYKIRLTAALLGLRFERVEYDIMKGETRTPSVPRAHQPARAHPRAAGGAALSCPKATRRAATSRTDRR